MPPPSADSTAAYRRVADDDDEDDDDVAAPRFVLNCFLAVVGKPIACPDHRSKTNEETFMVVLAAVLQHR